MWMRWSRSPSTPGTTADGIRTWVWGVWASWGAVALDQQGSLIMASSLDSLARTPELLPFHPPGHRLLVHPTYELSIEPHSSVPSVYECVRRLADASDRRRGLVSSRLSSLGPSHRPLASTVLGGREDFSFSSPFFHGSFRPIRRPMSTVWGVFLLSDTAPVPPLWWGESLRLGRVAFQ